MTEPRCEQAEQQRLLQAEEVALARVREIEAAVARVRGELAEATEKEREASELKVTSTGKLQVLHLNYQRSQRLDFPTRLLNTTLVAQHSIQKPT